MKPRPQLPISTWERLSAFQDGELPAEEADALADELARDPDLAAALAALRDQTAALAAPTAAPAGFADKVLAAVEHEPIPANRPWWQRVEVALVAVAAAAVLWVAIPWPGPPPEAPAQISPGPSRTVPAPVRPEVLPPAAPAAEVPRPKPAPGKIAAPSGEAEAPAPVPAPVAEPSGTADPEPAWVKPAGYSLRASDPKVLGRLKTAAARLGARLEDANGEPIGAELGTGAVFLKIPASRLSELDRELKGIGAVQAHRDQELLLDDTLEVQINVVLPAAE